MSETEQTVGRWYVLGFSADDVVASWQDARLAEECARAWREAGSTRPLAILQAVGDGDLFLCWFVDAEAAAVLDAAAVAWRRFLVGVRSAPPAGATPLDPG